MGGGNVLIVKYIYVLSCCGAGCFEMLDICAKLLFLTQCRVVFG